MIKERVRVCKTLNPLQLKMVTWFLSPKRNEVSRRLLYYSRCLWRETMIIKTDSRNRVHGSSLRQFSLYPPLIRDSFIQYLSLLLHVIKMLLPLLRVAKQGKLKRDTESIWTLTDFSCSKLVTLFFSSKLDLKCITCLCWRLTSKVAWFPPFVMQMNQTMMQT